MFLNSFNLYFSFYCYLPAQTYVKNKSFPEWRMLTKSCDSTTTIMKLLSVADCVDADKILILTAIRFMIASLLTDIVFIHL